MTTEDPSSWHPKIRALYEYWRSLLAAAGTLPGRSAFDPLAVHALLPHVMLIDVEGRPPRFRYRLIGTRIVDALGDDFTGRWLDEAHVGRTTHGATRPDGRPGPYFPAYERVAAERRPDWRRGPPMFVSYVDKCTELERLFLPLATNGRDVDMILAIAVFFDEAGQEI